MAHNGKLFCQSGLIFTNFSGQGTMGISSVRKLKPAWELEVMNATKQDSRHGIC